MKICCIYNQQDDVRASEMVNSTYKYGPVNRNKYDWPVDLLHFLLSFQRKKWVLKSPPKTGVRSSWKGKPSFNRWEHIKTWPKSAFCHCLNVPMGTFLLDPRWPCLNKRNPEILLEPLTMAIISRGNPRWVVYGSLIFELFWFVFNFGGGNKLKIKNMFAAYHWANQSDLIATSPSIVASGGTPVTKSKG